MNITVNCMGMKRNLGRAFDKLIDLINEGERTVDCHELNVIIDMDELISCTNSLRSAIATVAYTYIESEETPDLFPLFEFEGKMITEHAEEMRGNGEEEL